MTEIYRFGDLTLDTSRLALRRSGQRVALEPRSLELLIYLVEHRRSLVRREDLLESVWGGQHVTEAVLDQSVYQIRRALGDDPRSPQFIETVHGRGFVFLAEPEVTSPEGLLSESPGAGEGGSGGLRLFTAGLVFLLLAVVAAGVLWVGKRQPSSSMVIPRGGDASRPMVVALLPMVNATGDADFAWVELGLTDMLSEGLGGIKRLVAVPFPRVIAARERLGFQSLVTEEDVTRLREAVGAGWLVSTTLRRESDLLRVRATVYGPEGAVRTQDLVGTEIFSLGDEILHSVSVQLGVSQMRPTLAERYSADPLANRFYALGMEAQLRGRPEDALRFFEAASEQNPEMLWAVHEKTLALRKLGRWQESLDLTRQLIQEAEAEEDDALVGAAHNSLGILYWQQGRFESAESALRRALELSRRTGQQRNQASILVNLGILSSSRGKFAEAEEYFEASSQVAPLVGDPLLLANLSNSRGVLAWNTGKIESSRKHHEEALRLRRTGGERRLEAASLMNLGTVEEALGRFDQAEVSYAQSLALRRDLGDSAGAASTLANLGSLLSRTDRLTEAEKSLEEAIEIQRRLQQRAKLAISLTYLADLRRKQGDSAAARRALDEALTLYTEIGEPQGQVMTRVLLAGLACYEGELAAAESLVQAAERVATEVPTPVADANLQMIRGLIAARRSQLSESETLLRNALHLFRGLGNIAMESEVALELSNVFLEAGAISKAEESLSIVPEVARVGGRFLMLRARLASRKGETDAAARLGGEARVASRESWTPALEEEVKGFEKDAAAVIP